MRAEITEEQDVEELRPRLESARRVLVDPTVRISTCAGCRAFLLKEAWPWKR